MLLLIALAPLPYDYPDTIVLRAPRVAMIGEPTPDLAALTGGLITGGGSQAGIEDRAAVEAQRAVQDLRRALR